jgi:hypothetical protein
MKTLLLISTLTGLALMTGCTVTSGPYDASSDSGGIDPVTMAGIEASNRATDEAATAQFNQTQDMINTQNMIDTQNMVNQQNAAAAAAISQP